MGLNAKEIPPRLCKILQASYDTSYTFVQRHPVVSGVFSVFLIIYIFLSYIYSFLVYLSPFILCTAIFIRIFWSSEQPQLRYVKRERRRSSDYKHSRVASRNDFVLDRYYNYPSQYTRRRNLRDKKSGSHGGNNEFSNAVSERSTESRRASSVERSRESSDYVRPTGKHGSPGKQTLRSEPSLKDLVCYGLGESKGLEDIRDDDDDSHDERIKAVEWTENDHKNIMDIGFSELERNTRMETLIANRRARKLLKMQMDKGLNTNHIAHVSITRNNNFEEFDGLEMPDSAPSIVRPLRNPFDHRYDPSEEGKPISHQDFTKGHQDKTFSRYASFSVGRLRGFSDKGEHDRRIEQMFSREGTLDRDGSGLKSPTPQGNSKETDMVDMKGKKVKNAHSKESVSVQKNRKNRFPEIDRNMSVQRAGVSEKPGSGVHNKHPEKLHNFSISNSTTINESLFNSLSSPIERHQENMYYSGRRIGMTPTQSVASDLQVEVSEVGSPTLTVDGSNSSSDEESSVYDGDNEKDVTSEGEDMWGNSIHSREVHRIRDFEDIAEANPNKDILSAFPLQEIDEENSADVSSVSSTCDIPGDTPTCAASDGYNIFCNMREIAMQNETAQPLNSSDVPPSQAHSEKAEEWCSLYENYTNEAQDVKDVNDSAKIDKDHKVMITSNRDPVPSTMQQESIDEIHKQIPQSNKEDMAKTISTDQLHPEVKPHNMQPSINDPRPTVQSHNGDFSNPPVRIQEPSNKENEGESQTSMKQVPTEQLHANANAKDSTFSNNSEGNHDALNANEAIVSSKSAKESHKLSETEHSEEPGQVPQLENGKPSKQDKQNETLDEASYLQSKSKNLVEDDKDKSTIANNTKDASQPVVTESTVSTSAVDAEGKSAIEQGPNEIASKFPSKSGDSYEVIDTTNMEGDIKVPNPSKPNDETSKQ
ncbi:putative transmembrane protein [Senna tora]|uniref:Putative transmembrane protein n=1 Tax=Senna tora TaxID=362788 RepID=A0A834WWE8_9FABA|nr:putative transmembrane protein [Senna tora]